MLTTEQLQTLKTDVLANFPNASEHEAAAAYNLTASPDYWVWKSFVSDQDIYAVTTADATSWSWTIYIGRSQGERDAWRQMVNMAGGLNPSLANIRSGVADIFSGAGGANQRTHLLTIGRRKSTRGEKLFALATVGGSGNRGSTGNPDTMGFEGAVTAQDVINALSS